MRKAVTNSESYSWRSTAPMRACASSADLGLRRKTASSRPSFIEMFAPARSLKPPTEVALVTMPKRNSPSTVSPSWVTDMR